MEKRVFIHDKDHDIPVIIELPDQKDIYPCVILLHGLLAYKEGDGYLLRKLSKKLVSNQIATVRFDFASMGENRYGRKNYHLKTMQQEMETVFSYIQKQETINPQKIGVIGHSLGGMVACLTAHLESACIVTLNGVLSLDKAEFIRQILPFDHNREYGIIQTSDGRQELLYESFFTESIGCIRSYSFSYEKSMLICLGDQDPTIPNSLGLNFAQKENKEVLIIKNANHTFNAKLKDDAKVYEMADKVNEWLDIHLK